MRSQISWSRAVFVIAQLGERSLKLHYKKVTMKKIIICLQSSVGMLKTLKMDADLVFCREQKHRPTAEFKLYMD